MRKLDHTLLLFIVIILEGYVVLSSELLAIRLTIPFVGSGTDTVSIIIAAVLMPLAFGYYSGGRFRPGFKNGRYISVRRKLIFNIITAMVILLAGLSYALLAVFFMVLINAGIDNRLIMATLYSLLFIVTPVYLLGQTIPLVSNFFSQEKLSPITGRMLFVSTVGSFFGAVFSTLVLMSSIGVHYTAALNFMILAFLVILLSRRKFSEPVIYAAGIAAAALALNSGYVMDIFHIVENNKYNTIAVYEEDGQRELVMNNNSSSLYTDDGHKHEYIEFAERMALTPILGSNPPKEILIIGAGAFTFGIDDTNNHYDFVDIDESLQRVSEDYILKKKLTPNKIFHPIEARAFLMKTDKKYDVIFLDAYLGDLTIPEHLVTREFFQQVKKHLKERSIVMANFIVSPNFANQYSRNIDNTFRTAFPYISRHVIQEGYDPWNESRNMMANVIYIYSQQPDTDAGHIYTDNKNTIFLDKPKRRESQEDREIQE